MTIDLHATLPTATATSEDIVRFVFRSTVSSGLLENARAMLAAAPKELAESFEQSVRGAGFAS